MPSCKLEMSPCTVLIIFALIPLHIIVSHLLLCTLKVRHWWKIDWIIVHVFFSFVFTAFATGTALHGDILCSLCKHTRDVMCTMKLCVDPERGQNAVESGVQCMQGFCRWQKETVASSGFNNYYHAWWQPQNLFFFFNHVSKEIATAYNEFVVSTSKAIHGLG